MISAGLFEVHAILTSFLPRRAGAAADAPAMAEIAGARDSPDFAFLGW